MKNLFFSLLIIIICGCSSSEYIQEMGNVSYDEINSRYITYVEGEYFYMKSPMIVNKENVQSLTKAAFIENENYLAHYIQTKVTDNTGSRLTIEQNALLSSMSESIAKALLEDVAPRDSWSGKRINSTGGEVWDGIIVVRVKEKKLQEFARKFRNGEYNKYFNMSKQEIDESIKREIKE